MAAEIPNSKHVLPVLRLINEKEHVLKTDLLDVIPSPGTMMILVDKLVKSGVIVQDTVLVKGKRVFLSLTPKGRIVLHKLEQISDIEKEIYGPGASNDLAQKAQEESPDFKIPRFIFPSEDSRFKDLKALVHLNALGDHMLVEEVGFRGKTNQVFAVYGRSEGGTYDLWCEQDNSTSCKHVNYLWSFPDVRDGFRELEKLGKLKRKETFEKNQRKKDAVEN